MVYKPNIPLLTDRLPKSQKDFIENFRKINQYWSIDHIDLSQAEPEKPGLHKQLTLPEQGADPGTAANEIAVYSKSSSGNSDIYWRIPSNGAVSKLFSKDRVALGGLKLEAYCAFDTRNGEFLQTKIKKPGNPEGQMVEVKSFNVTSVTVPATPTQFTINFSPTLSSADFFYTIDAYQSRTTVPLPLIPAYVQPTAKNDSVYSNTCSTSAFVIEGRTLNASPNTPFYLYDTHKFLMVQIWTVS